MKTKITDKKLLAFLKEKKVVKQFEKNCRTLSGDFDSSPYAYSILTAFIWINSPEGKNFWEKLSDEFETGIE